MNGDGDLRRTFTKMALFGFLNRAHVGSIEWRVLSYFSRMIAKSSPSLTVGLGRASSLISSLYFPVSIHNCKAVDGGGLTVLRCGDTALLTRLFELLELLLLDSGILYPTFWACFVRAFFGCGIGAEALCCEL
jgi:hypothetical protein